MTESQTHRFSSPFCSLLFSLPPAPLAAPATFGSPTAPPTSISTSPLFTLFSLSSTSCSAGRPNTGIADLLLAEPLEETLGSPTAPPTRRARRERLTCWRCDSGWRERVVGSREGCSIASVGNEERGGGSQRKEEKGEEKSAGVLFSPTWITSSNPSFRRSFPSPPPVKEERNSLEFLNVPILGVLTPLETTCLLLLVALYSAGTVVTRLTPRARIWPSAASSGEERAKVGEEKRRREVARSRVDRIACFKGYCLCCCFKL